MLYIFLRYIKHPVTDASIVTQCCIVCLLFVPANQQPVENLVIIDFYRQNLTCRLTIIDKYRVLSTYRLRFP